MGEIKLEVGQRVRLRNGAVYVVKANRWKFRVGCGMYLENRCAVIQWVLSHPEAFRKRRVNSAKPSKTAQNPYKTEQNLEPEKS